MYNWTFLPKMLFCVVVLSVFVCALFIVRSKHNSIKFQRAYNSVYVGQSLSDLHDVLHKNGVKIDSESSGSLAAFVSVGFENDLVMDIEIDESKKVVKKDAHDTGFNILFF